jgi:uncharacterized protein YsxB (DUF464 family)
VEDELVEWFLERIPLLLFLLLVTPLRKIVLSRTSTHQNLSKLNENVNVCASVCMILSTTACTLNQRKRCMQDKEGKKKVFFELTPRRPFQQKDFIAASRIASEERRDGTKFHTTYAYDYCYP